MKDHEGDISKSIQLRIKCLKEHTDLSIIKGGGVNELMEREVIISSRENSTYED